MLILYSYQDWFIISGFYQMAGWQCAVIPEMVLSRTGHELHKKVANG